MTSFKLRLTTMVAALAVTATSFMPAHSMPLPAAPAPAAQEMTTNVQYRDRDRWERRWDRRQDRRESRRDYRRGYREGFYNGHRGFRERRSGYRYHNGYWFPLAAFAAGAIIGGAASSQARPSYGGSSHVQWCADRYRSYRASDNTFQPYGGPRQQCRSPY